MTMKHVNRDVIGSRPKKARSSGMICGEKCVQGLTSRESADQCSNFCSLFCSRFAIYIPLFLPIGLPIIGSMFAAIKWFRGGKSGAPERKKSDKPKTE